MEDRKLKEIEYYDRRAGDAEGDFEGFKPQNLSSYRFLYKLLKENCKDKLVLDYGCGNGIHSLELVRNGAKKVIGIDLSENSLAVAKKRVKRAGFEDKVEFLKMDCEKTDFPDNYFDIILDGGTFSSLDISKAIPELSRVLKPEGMLVGIETFGHNPLTNLKRRMNKIIGKRTGWATEHIFQMKDLELAKKHFSKIEARYFHLISWLAFPFLNLPGGTIFLRLLEFFDRALLRTSFLKRYSFKIVFIFSSKKHGKTLI